jgi:hypothetical protein
VVDLVSFLTARVAERQAVIMNAVRKSRTGERTDRGESKVVIEQRIRGMADVELDVVNQMIQEVEAVRRIMGAHRTSVTDRVPGFPMHGGEYWCETCHVPGDEAGSNWCVTMRLLALPYADHPAYDQKWRP